jgi:putative nucleotidyltransferase with HDIG domain
MKFRKRLQTAFERFNTSRSVRWTLLVAVTAAFVLILHPRLVMTTADYKLGDIADRDIKAPRDFFIENHAATEASRQRAMDEVMTVYDYDPSLAERLSKRVERAFARVRSAIGPSGKSASTEMPSTGQPDLTDRSPASLHDEIWRLKEPFQETIGFFVSDGAYKILETEKFSQHIAGLIETIVTSILNHGVVTSKEILLRETHRGIILRDVQSKTEKVVSDLDRFYGLDKARSTVRETAAPLLNTLDYNLRNLIIDFAQAMIQPNITFNRNETDERRKLAAASVKPVVSRVKAGEMLLREGQRVGQVQLLELEALRSQTRNQHLVFNSLGAAVLMVCLLLISYTLYCCRERETGRAHNKDLLFIACVLVTFFLITGISASLARNLTAQAPFSVSSTSVYYGIPLAAGAMTICLFLGLDMAVSFALVLSICAALLLQNRFSLFFYFLLNGSMAAYWVRHSRERKIFIIAGLKVSVLNVLLVTALNLYQGNSIGFATVWDWGFAFSGGIVSGVITAGLAPLVEMAFGYRMDITLLELANLDQPILRRLMIEAPGTYHHSVIVGSMVEAAASEIGANPLLAKVCGYYHDIGKIKKPLYFIENQTDGKNRHNKLAPSMSSLILMSHIKEGVEIARKNKLGQDIRDVIQQHHGTSLIRYFYEKAKQQKGEDAVNIDDFRYAGPKPQTREAGLVMLADVVEASSRTLENPTPSRIQGHVQRQINQVFSDGQLDECELTLKDLHSIAKSFNKILSGIHHHRIEYPENAAATGNGRDRNKNRKNGSTDREPAKLPPVVPGKNPSDSASHLRRLGQS